MFAGGSLGGVRLLGTEVSVDGRCVTAHMNAHVVLSDFNQSVNVPACVIGTTIYCS